MDLNAIMSKIISRANLQLIERFKTSKRKNLVYTSFDGDYMHFLPDMMEFCLINGCIPINPEAALGYYVSTKTHGGQKIPVMKDCMKTELLCDEMWIFNPENSHIPEGVLAEMMLWFQHRTNGIKVIPFFAGLESKYSPKKLSSEDITVTKILDCDMQNIIKTKKASDVQEITDKLLNNLDSSFSSTYIVANFYNLKHIDWTREYCYKNKLCPVSPQNILPYYTYKCLFENYQEAYLEDRLTILDKTEKMVWFTNCNNWERELDNLDEYSCTELYYWCTYRNKSDIIVLDWADAEVPKYLKNNQWAITSTESMEIIK